MKSQQAGLQGTRQVEGRNDATVLNRTYQLVIVAPCYDDVYSLEG